MDPCPLREKALRLAFFVSTIGTDTMIHTRSINMKEMAGPNHRRGLRVRFGGFVPRSRLSLWLRLALDPPLVDDDPLGAIAIRRFVERAELSRNFGICIVVVAYTVGLRYNDGI